MPIPIILCLAILLGGFSFVPKKEMHVDLVFNHQFGAEALKLHQRYVSKHGDTVMLTRLQYYISNIQLMKADGSIWKEKESYHLVKLEEDQGSKVRLSIDHIPVGDYTGLAFSIGVDAKRNSGGSQIGDLDPIQGMFWTWSQGYIFFKTEGYHFKPIGKRGGLIFHIGGDETFRSLEFSCKNNPITPKRAKEGLQIDVDMQKFFGGFPGAGIDLVIPENGRSISVMGGVKSTLIADNYKQIFSLEDNSIK